MHSLSPDHPRPRFIAAAGPTLFYVAFCLTLASGCGSDTTTQEDPKPGDRLAAKAARVKPEKRDDNGQEMATAANVPQPDQPLNLPTISTQPNPSTQSSPQGSSSSVSLPQAEALLANGKLEQAQAAANELLIRDPENPRVIFLSANVQAEQGNLGEAIDLISAITVEDREAFLPSLGMTADWLSQAGRYDEAIAKYKQIIQYVPQAAMAHRRAANLLNRQGRRQEASEHVRQLCRLGDVRQPELQTLLSIPVAYYDASAQSDEDADPALRPISTLGRARIAFTKGDFDTVIEMMDGLAAKRPLEPVEQAFLGRAFVSDQDFDRMPAWLAATSDQSKAFGDYWFAIGVWLANQSKHEQACEAFAQTLRITPSDRIAMNLLAGSLTAQDKPKDAEWLRDRADRLGIAFKVANRINRSATPTQFDLEFLSDLLLSLDRPLEAIMWNAVAAVNGPNPQERMAALNEQRLDAIRHPIAPEVHLPLTLRTKQGETPGFDWLADLPRESNSGSTVVTKPMPSLPARLANVADQVNLDGRYFNEVQQTDDLYIMHTGIGGGVAVIDFDLDGRPDLYFPQGASEPDLDDLDQWNGQKPNQLFRNLGDTLEDVVLQAAADDRGYGQGATAGDFNADGFPDLFIGNIGRNTLLINNGDGTFSDRSESINQSRSLWSTSVAMADLDGDHLPELIETNYVDDPVVFEDPVAIGGEADPTKPLPPRLMPSPENFNGGPDRVYRNLGDGTVTLETLSLDDQQPAGNGLAILVTDIDGTGGNEIFVANDMHPNNFWIREQPTPSADVSWSMTNIARRAGCAFSGRGDRNACMGIAAADFTENGRLDFAVTNFYREPMNFFVQKQPAQFTDEAARFDLFEIGYNLNGFGTQPIDYDNNGRFDLVVMNGHIHDNSAFGVPFRMLPQLIDGSDNRFRVIDGVEDGSGYWQTPSLGRAVATLDWNADGMMDLVTTHLDLPHALVENQTPQTNHWLQLRLVGTTSERDAIGATVRLGIGDRDLVDSVKTGDGFECKNQPLVSFGLGDTDLIDEIEVTWPSGQSQSFRNVTTDRRLLVVEGRSQPIELLRRPAE